MDKKIKITYIFSPFFILLFGFIFWHSCSDEDLNGVRSFAEPSPITGKADDSIAKYNHPYLNKPNAFLASAQFDSALYCYANAITLFEKENNWEAMVYTLNKVAYIYIWKTDYDKAYGTLNKALKIASAKLSPLHPFVSFTYYYLGLYYDYKGEQEKSLISHHKALELRQKLFSQSSIYLAESYNAIGNVHRYTRFDYHEAEKYYAKALKLRGKKDADYRNLAVSYYNLSTTNYLKGDFDKAISFGYETLRILSLHDSNNYIFLSKSHSNLAIYISEADQGADFSGENYTTALNHLTQAIALNVKGNGSKTDFGSYHNSMANIYIKMKQYVKALNYCKTTLDILDKRNQMHLPIIANTNLQIGNIYLGVHNPDSALFYFRQSLAQRISYYGNKHIWIAEANHYIGKVFAYKRTIDSAFYYYQRALITGVKNFEDNEVTVNPHSNLLKNNFYLFNIICDKAHLFKQKYFLSKNINNLKSSLKCYQLADSLIDLQRQFYDRENSKLLLTKNTQPMYEQALDCILELHQATGDEQYKAYAFDFMERGKSRVLLEALNQAETLNKTGIPDSTREKERALKVDHAFYHHQLELALNDDPADKIKIQDIRSKLFKVEQELQKLKEILSQKYSSYFKVKYENLMDFRSLKSFIKSGMIEYYWGDSAIYGLSLNKDKSKLLKIDKAKVEKLVLDYQAHISQNNQESYVKSSFENYVNTAFLLYITLVQPFLGAQHDPETGPDPLLIIPDGPLSYIPFESFIQTLQAYNHVDYKNLDYMLLNYTINYAYSANFLLRSVEKRSSSKELSLFGLAYSGSNTRHRKGDLSKEKLPGTSKELKTISTLIDGTCVEGENATEYIFKKNAHQYDIIHLAMHGQATPSEASSRIFFPNSKDSVEDGILFPHELYNLKLNAKLTVLSACETGIGKLQKGEGVYSIGRAFAYAGCPSVVMSLWKVNDYTTADLMKDFYSKLVSGSSIDLSLFDAKRNYLEKADELTAHPFNWAGFILMGDVSPIKQSGSFYYYLRVLLLLIITGTVLFYLIKFIKK